MVLKRTHIPQVWEALQQDNIYATCSLQSINKIKLNYIHINTYNYKIKFVYQQKIATFLTTIALCTQEKIKISLVRNKMFDFYRSLCF